MSRLIDADKLIDELIDESIYEWVDRNGKIDISYVRALIYKQPTAYDVDKVISNIWDKSELIHIKHNCYDEVEDYIRVTDATEIVREGGIDDIYDNTINNG